MINARIAKVFKEIDWAKFGILPSGSIRTTDKKTYCPLQELTGQHWGYIVVARQSYGLTMDDADTIMDAADKIWLHEGNKRQVRKAMRDRISKAKRKHG